MDDKIKKFSDFEYKSNLAKAVVKDEDGDYEEISGSITIIQITGVLTDVEEIKKVEEAISIDTSLTVKNVERGKVLWLTCLLQKVGTKASNPQQLGIIKVRVMDYFYGLNKLSSIRND